MKKTLLILATIIGILTLTACGSGSHQSFDENGNVTNTKTQKESVSIYTEIHSEWHGDREITIYHNKVNGCISEYIEFTHIKKAGSSWKAVLDRTSTPICDVSLEEAIELFKRP